MNIDFLKIELGKPQYPCFNLHRVSGNSYLIYYTDDTWGVAGKHYSARARIFPGPYIGLHKSTHLSVPWGGMHIYSSSIFSDCLLIYLLAKNDNN